ncbi:cysteine desulfurase activator complex subunit SufB [Anaerotignum neopropionicum]|uniref:Cysteine desulfurase activator complex subunit SufB n=1 Tax=Anaerotignum neopropionicum TaxID=36847 RepID=A0A136WHY4_9FIRM|nr:SufD family Fe-S cluster assembly protein [Anaerotignum neopropionicum]KXL53990.1 cysteine desulfurase activator complex subunit SufB [Anaerotignum neopropionicum]
MLSDVIKNLLSEVAGIQTIPTTGAFNIRNNGKSAGSSSTKNIQIIPKADGSGIDIYIKPGTKNESVHIPALVTETDMHDVVYNDFHIGEDADVTIVAGCGIHNCGSGISQHDGIHRFYVGKNAIMKYVEKHIGEGEGDGQNIINPQTHIIAEDNSYIEMDTVQLKGVDSTNRISSAKLAAGATVVIKEKIMTHGSQYAETSFDVDLEGEGSSAKLISRSVARDNSRQLFRSKLCGENACYGHSECDAIIMDNGIVAAEPEIIANNVDATLIHEAAIGKIAGEQLTKLMTLGLTEKEAEAQIINGFLK